MGSRFAVPRDGHQSFGPADLCSGAFCAGLVAAAACDVGAPPRVCAAVDMLCESYINLATRFGSTPPPPGAAQPARRMRNFNSPFSSSHGIKC